MNIIVCMKQVIDLEQIRIKADSRQPVLDGLPVLFGDFDKCALEESVRIKEKQGGKVTAVAAGSATDRYSIIITTRISTEPKSV